MRRSCSLAIAAAAVGLILAVPANGASFEVTKRGDPAPGSCGANDCSLREAILAANAAPGADRIVLPKRKVHQLSIAGDDDGAMVGDLDVTNDPLRIIHRRKGRATIDFNPPGDGSPDPLDRVFQVFGGAPLTLKKLVITDGGDPTGPPGGGGIHAGEDVTLLRSRVVGNESPSIGGGIHTTGGVRLTVRNSAVKGNTADSDGGGIYHVTGSSALPGDLRMTKSVVSGNVGGEGAGLYFSANELPESFIRRSTISGNRSDDEGGGILADGGRLTISGTTISGNSAEGHGGGMSVDGPDFLAMVNSTIANNRADAAGGGINAGTDVQVNAVTVARNRANADGIANEDGGGIFIETGTVFTVENSLLALNTQGDPLVRNDCSGGDPFLSGGHNLLTTSSLCEGFDAGGDRVRQNPKIGALKRNGGPTKTIALKKGSPAINRAKASSSPKRDQRGVKRRNPDIGAYER